MPCCVFGITLACAGSLLMCGCLCAALLLGTTVSTNCFGKLQRYMLTHSLTAPCGAMLYLKETIQILQGQHHPRAHTTQTRAQQVAGCICSAAAANKSALGKRAYVHLSRQPHTQPASDDLQAPNKYNS